MALTDEFGSLAGNIGIDTTGWLGGVGNFIYLLITFFVVALLVGAILYYFLNKKQYTKKIQIFEEINGKPAPAGMDYAKEITIPDSSIRIFQLKNRNLFLPRPTIQTGKDNYWFFIRKDHEWVNVGLDNLNDKLNDLNVHYDHTDMRYANSSLKELIKSNYGEKNWLKEYAPYIAIGFLIVFLGITFYLIADQLGTVASSLSATVDANNKVLEATTRLLEVANGGQGVSGLKPSI